MLLKIRRSLIVLYSTLNDLIIFYPKLKKTILKNLGRSPELILDVGANKGQSISFFLKLNKNAIIYSFEPTASLFNYLVEKYKSYSNIIVSNKGISSYIGKKRFYENYLNLTSSFEKLNYNSQYLKYKSKVLGIGLHEIVKNEYDVDVITLNSFINENIKSDIDIIKIDVEGHEYQCLKGIFNKPLNSSINLIQLEYHNDDMYKNAIYFNKINEILNNNNFQLVKRFKHGFGGFEDLLYQNKKYINLKKKDVKEKM